MLKRNAFLRTGAALGAAAAIPAPAAFAATGKPVVKIGFLESFSGVFSDLGAYHKIGATLALEDANAKGRVRYEFATGDDASKPAEAINEAKRLVSQEKVDVLYGGVSSANGLATEAFALDAGIFYLCVGPQTSAITTEKASLTTFRFSQNARMFVKALSRRILAQGKKWYFLQADYAFGKDAYNQLSGLLKRAGGTDLGVDVLPLGTTDFSSAMVKLRNSDAEVLVLCQGGLDVANACKAFVEYGLHKKMRLAGINIEDIYYKALPLDAIAGATFPVSWSPLYEHGKELAARFRKSFNGPISSRHYFGYMTMASLIERINSAGTTSADKLVAAFSDHSFFAYKGNASTWRGCDHQCIQDTYAGEVVNQKKFDKQQFMFDIVGEVPAAESDGNCDSPWAMTAKKAIAAQKFAARDGYTPVSLR